MNPKHSPGFGLVEILIALFIFSTGILALIQLQWFSTQHNQQIVLHATALNHTYQLLEQTSIFAVLDVAVMKNWQQQIKRMLPEGKGQLEQQAGKFQITVSWQGKSLSHAERSGAACCVLVRSKANEN